MVKLLLIVLPAVLFAGNISISLENKNGSSYYTVEDPAHQLKSKLVFPFEMNAVALEYVADIYGFKLAFSSSFLLDSKTTTGKDYDWQNGTMTVFSTSDDKINRYADYKLEVSRNILKHLDIVGSFRYKYVDMEWSDTHQEDFVQHTTVDLQGTTLRYEQTFYQYNLGLEYEAALPKDFIFKIKPSAIYTYIEAKDTHLLRDFYTMQYSNAFGYGVKIDLEKKVYKNSTLVLNFSYEAFEDKDTDMKFFNSQNQNYVTYPSSFKYSNRTFGIKYIYSF